jgi:hypothetical protein
MTNLETNKHPLKQTVLFIINEGYKERDNGNGQVLPDL